MSTSSIETIPVQNFGRTVAQLCSARGPYETPPLLSLCSAIHPLDEDRKAELLRRCKMHACKSGLIEIVLIGDAAEGDTLAALGITSAEQRIRYARAESDENPALYLQILTQHVAEGSYCWALPLSTPLREDVLETVLQHLATATEDFLLLTEKSPNTSPGKNTIKGRAACLFGDLLEVTMESTLLGDLPTSIFKTEALREGNKAPITKECGPRWQNAAYYQARVLADALWTKGAGILDLKPLKSPAASNTDKSQRAEFLLLQQPALLDQYGILGLNSRTLQAYRENLVRNSGETLAQTMLDPSAPAHEDFDLLAYLKQNESCAQLIFDQLDIILSLARRHATTSKHIEAAKQLILRYPARRPRPPATPVARSFEGFKACLGTVPELVKAGRLQDAANALHRSKLLAPNQECVQLVLNYFALFIREGILAFPKEEHTELS